MTKHAPIAERKISIQGYAIGFEIVQNGLTLKKVTYDKPVKNLVVTAGKDAFFAPGINYNTGVPLSWLTTYSARGSGSTPTSAGMTTMESQIGNRTNQYLSGHPNTGVRYDRTTGTIYLRKTYDFEVESSNQNINEVGFFTASSSGTMFARVVLPATVTVLTGQQLRLTYELQVTIGPVTSTPATPTITGWTTDGDQLLEGTFPETSTTFGSSPNQFIGVWGTDGVKVLSSGGDIFLLEPSFFSTVSTAQFAGVASASATVTLALLQSKSFAAFGTLWTRPASNPPTTSIAGSSAAGANSPGTVTCTLAAYTPGAFYRDITWVLNPNFPGVSISPIAIQAKGLVHIFDAAQTKTGTQRLTLTVRISLT